MSAVSAVAELTRADTGIRVQVVDCGGGALPPEAVARMLGEAGMTPVPAPAGTVVVAVAATLEDAITAGAGLAPRLLAVCDTVTPTDLRRALRAGVCAILRSTDLTPRQLAAAVHCAHHGEGRIPYTALVRLLGGDTPSAPRPSSSASASSSPSPSRERPEAADLPQLTARQTTVLTLMAEGHGNAGIAQTLSCSQHTVKNVIYELMSRLQACNRAHAVACAVRLNLI